MSFAWFASAALLEIAGCYAFWAWLRLDQSPLWALPGALLLILFAVALTRIDAEFAGRAYAAYGGVYILASMTWLMVVERATPLWSDLVGTAVLITGAAIILLGPRLAGAN